MRLGKAEDAAMTREPGSLPGNHDSAQLFDGESSEKRASLPHPVRGMGRLFVFCPIPSELPAAANTRRESGRRSLAWASQKSKAESQESKAEGQRLRGQQRR